MRSRHGGMLIKPVWTCLAVALVFVGGGLAIAGPALMDVSPQPRQARDREPAMLTDEDIGLIKVYEVDLDSDTPPRIDIPDDKLREFLEEFKEDDRIPRGKDKQRDWIRGDGHEQLSLMFTLRARDYYKHVRVQSQVESLREWHRQHRSYVLGYFQEHFGDGDVPGLFLFPQGRESNRIEMTNFFILTQVSIDGKRLIDRNNPEESLLVQWGLPREDAKFAAPDIEGWRPKFRDKNDPRFEALVEWIESLFRENQGSDYGVEYEVPGQRRRAAD